MVTQFFPINCSVLVLLASTVACAGSLSIGLGAAGSAGLMTLPSFLARFFPSIAARLSAEQQCSASNPWCTLQNSTLQLFQSIPNLSAVPMAITASFMSDRLGRRDTLLAAASLYLLAVTLAATAGSMAMLIAGRVILGFAVGGILQSAPLYLSEVASPSLRGALGSVYTACMGAGVAVAAAANFAVSKIQAPWSWRVAFAVQAPPALFVVAAGWLLPDSPSSLVARGRREEGLRVLRRLRGEGSGSLRNTPGGGRASFQQPPAAVGEEGHHASTLGCTCDSPCCSGRLSRKRSRDVAPAPPPGGDVAGVCAQLKISPPAVAAAGSIASEPRDSKPPPCSPPHIPPHSGTTTSEGGGGGGGGARVSVSVEDPVLEEFEGIERACLEAGLGSGRSAWGGWRLLLTGRQYRPSLVITLLVATTVNLTGPVNTEYAPALLRTMGASPDLALLLGVLVAAVYAVAALLAAGAMDRVGRKGMLLVGGSVLAATQVGLAGLLGWAFESVFDPWEGLPAGVMAGTVVLLCCAVAGFGTSWGALSNLTPCEVLPLRVRAAGQALNAALNLGVLFLMEMFYLTLLCGARWGLWVTFAGCGLLGMLGVMLLMPETKGAPIERVWDLFRKHWLWGRVLQPGSAPPGSMIGAETCVQEIEIRDGAPLKTLDPK